MHPLLQSFIGEVLAKYWGEPSQLATDSVNIAATLQKCHRFLAACALMQIGHPQL